MRRGKSGEGHSESFTMAKVSQQLIEEALNDFQGPLIGYAMGFLKDLDRSKDVVQDTFIKLSQQKTEKVERGLKTWLFTVCRNGALDQIRKNKRLVALDDDNRAELVSEDWSPDERADQEDQHQVIWQLIDRLSDNQQEVIRLKFQQDLSYREIAELTGLKEGNVGFLLHTGLKRLREMMPEELQPSHLKS